MYASCRLIHDTCASSVDTRYTDWTGLDARVRVPVPKRTRVIQSLAKVLDPRHSLRKWKWRYWYSTSSRTTETYYVRKAQLSGIERRIINKVDHDDPVY